MHGMGNTALADLFRGLGSGEVHAVAAVDVDIHKAGSSIAAGTVNNLNAIFGFGKILFINSNDLSVFHVDSAVGEQLRRCD